MTFACNASTIIIDRILATCMSTDISVFIYINRSSHQILSVLFRKGHPRLVNVLAKLYSKVLSITLDPNAHILTTIGAFQGLSSICHSLISPGDEVRPRLSLVCRVWKVGH